MMPALPFYQRPSKALRPRPGIDLPPLRSERVGQKLRERQHPTHDGLRTEETGVCRGRP